MICRSTAVMQGWCRVRSWEQYHLNDYICFWASRDTQDFIIYSKNADVGQVSYTLNMYVTSYSKLIVIQDKLALLK